RESERERERKRESVCERMNVSMCVCACLCVCIYACIGVSHKYLGVFYTLAAQSSHHKVFPHTHTQTHTNTHTVYANFPHHSWPDLKTVGATGIPASRSNISLWLCCGSL